MSKVMLKFFFLNLNLFKLTSFEIFLLFTGVAHYEDLWYIWHKPGQPSPKCTDKVVSDRVLKLWRNFMEHGWDF